MAFFEAASVDAFALLASELRAHEAPESLIRSCHAARRDEVRHARMASKLARRHGAEVPLPPPLRKGEARSLEAIATENVVEGCVRETFGVLVGMWQAEHAPTAELRAFFGVLAADEARHSALAMRIDAWLQSRLSASQRARVEAARERALLTVERSLILEPVAGVGLPGPATAHTLFNSWVASVSELAA